MKRWATIAFAGLIVSGCVIAPEEAKVEQGKAAEAGRVYATTRSSRVVPDLPEKPTWREVLTRAFLSNGDLEASYFEWAMAASRIDQAGTWPAQSLELGYGYMFSGERLKALDRSTLSSNLMDPTPLPNATYQDAKVAWREAEAAGERFRQAKFELQVRVLAAWADYALQAERIRVGEADVRLLKTAVDTTATRVRSGAPQRDLLRAQLELEKSQNDLQTQRSELLRQRAMLNAMLVRPTAAPLEPPAEIPEARFLPADDARLLLLGSRNNPEIAALDKDALARDAAIERAKLEYQPQVNLAAAFTGSLSQTVGGSVLLPTRIPAIRAMVAEARADLRRTEALVAQRRADKASAFLATLVALRDAERRRRTLEADILPLATRALDLTRRSYASGAATYLDLIDGQRGLLEIRLMIAESRAMRERLLAELEALAGADVETLDAHASEVWGERAVAATTIRSSPPATARATSHSEGMEPTP
jgi:cobalt-zinc-cadmium efflux system outer membrane protein